jgi:hypothetical protein
MKGLKYKVNLKTPFLKVKQQLLGTSTKHQEIV